jgi:DNA polymerase III delta prime subunit
MDICPNDESIVQELIRYIKRMITNNFAPLKVIKDPALLVEALEELDSMVEMDGIKITIVGQIQVMLVLAYKRFQKGSVGSHFDDHMLHGIVYGPPGVGKSSAARKIAKIFYAVGVIDQIKNKISTKTDKKESFTYIPTASTFENLPPSPNLPQLNSDAVEPITHEAGKMLSDINKFRVSVNELSRKIKCDEEIKEEDASIITQQSVDIAFKCTNIISLCQTVSRDEKKNVIPFGAATLTMNPPKLPRPKLQTSFPEQPQPFNGNSSPPPTSSIKEEHTSKDSYIVVCGRSELVAEYSGQSTIKTFDYLMANRGKVIIIEEAYLLYTGDRDQFGMEALTELNRFMDERPTEVIIYMTGYRELMLKTIFSAQPGLNRRFSEVFNIEGYTSNGLMKIFKQQMESKDWTLDPNADLDTFFETHHDTFKHFGGDTLTLSYQCKKAYASLAFKDMFESLGVSSSTPKETKLIITLPMIVDALENFKGSRVKAKTPSKESAPPEGMYN